MNIKRNALFDQTKKYRYLLTRKWADGNEKITWIMLNPSTADAFKDDPTIRRCIGFSQKWGASNLDIVNLFAYRSTDPRKLYKIDDPIGAKNDEIILNSTKNAKKIIIAWGNHGILYDRDKYVLSNLLKEYSNKIYILKRLKSGQPGHPLYIPYNTKLMLWSKYEED